MSVKLWNNFESPLNRLLEIQDLSAQALKSKKFIDTKFKEKAIFVYSL